MIRDDKMVLDHGGGDANATNRVVICPSRNDNESSSLALKAAFDFAKGRLMVMHHAVQIE
jgi:hypothetical protein